MKSLVLLAGFVATALSCEPDTRNISAIYSAAQQENGTLQVAVGGDERSQSDGLAQAFKAAFPLVRANFTTDLSKYHDGRINLAHASNTHYADVTMLQTVQDFDDWKERGMLLNYKPAVFDKLWNQFKDADGAYLPVYGGQFGRFVAKRNTPKSYADVVKPEWRGALCLTYPNDDDAVQFLFTLIVQKYGWQWIKNLAKQDVQWVRGTATPATIMAEGQASSNNLTEASSNRTLSFTTYPPAQDWSFNEPGIDPYMRWFQTAAILNNTKMPETSKLLISFLVSDQYQKTYLAQGTPSARSDLGVGNTTDLNTVLTRAQEFKKFMKDRKLVEAWRFKFEDVLGTAQGLSPLLDNIGN